MDTAKPFIASISAIDKAYADAIAKDSPSNLGSVKELGQKKWVDELKAALKNAIDINGISPEKLKAGVDKKYGDSYISPLFKGVVQTYKYDDLPYAISKKDFGTLISTLRKARKASSIETFLEGFKQGFDRDQSDNFQRFLAQEFKPRHPLHYWLNRAVRKEKNSFLVNADHTITSVSTILGCPQIHSKQELIFAFALAAGVDPSSARQLKDVRLINDKVTFKVKNEKEIKQTLLCQPSSFMKTWEFICSHPISESYVHNINDDVAHNVLGIRGVSTRSLPVLYNALLEHFQLADKESHPKSSDSLTSSFQIEGAKNIIKTIETHQQALSEKQYSIIYGLPEHIRNLFFHAVDYFDKHPSEKIVVITIRQILNKQLGLACSPNDARILRVCFDNVFLLRGAT
ncbi:MAG: hypothetical protein M3Q07_06445 [Pseudobdellovibrionaceae bacterium]|nr:hypothetical protein [Pseudobdellovibrionaceae bacterium]